MLHLHINLEYSNENINQRKCSIFLPRLASCNSIDSWVLIVWKIVSVLFIRIHWPWQRPKCCSHCSHTSRLHWIFLLEHTKEAPLIMYEMKGKKYTTRINKSSFSPCFVMMERKSLISIRKRRRLLGNFL